MSFLAKLLIEDSEEELNVLQCNFEFTHQIDYSGFPTGRLKAGLIRIVVESTKFTDLLDWIISDRIKDGKVDFYSRDAVMSRNKTLEFKEARCVEYRESFDSENATAMRTNIAIFAQVIEVNDVSHEVLWRENEDTYE